jgi:alpha-L-arabinofuranosidase
MVFAAGVVGVAAMLTGLAAGGQTSTTLAARLTIDTGTIVGPVSPTLYGMMTEEINHAFDGGLYVEMLNNRTFRPSWEGIEHWDLVQRGNANAAMEADHATGPSQALPYSVKLTVRDASIGNEAGISNSGFWGIALKGHTTYRGSFYAKVDDDGIGPVRVRLIHNSTGVTMAETTVTLHAGAWSQYQYTLTPGPIAASTDNHLELTVAHPGTIWMQLASLMPPTFHGRANGNRPDLMEKMAGLHPTFLRLPGGNYLEGDTLRDWYNWKETIGPLVDRPGHQAPWTYWSTDGLGLLEFLEWCEDLKIEPVLAVYAGYSLHGAHVTPGKDLEPYIQSALDEIEYVTGDTSTKWGAERAKDGHPAPFPLRYIEIGNEDWFDKSGSYDARFGQFAKALHRRYPQYKLIATAQVKEKDSDEQPDVIDDHYYKPWGDMLGFTHHYDDAPRNGPKIFIGEWATLSGGPTPNFGGALADAAWMTSMERNSDLIIMAAYAPLLVNVNPGASQWGTNLIGYDAAKSYASPSYWAQSLFAGHLGDETPKSTIQGAGPRFYYSATVDSRQHVLHLKMVNASDKGQPLMVEVAGMPAVGTAAKISLLHAATYEATNTLADPNAIHPVESTVKIGSTTWAHTVPGLTIEVIDIALR